MKPGRIWPTGGGGSINPGHGGQVGSGEDTIGGGSSNIDTWPILEGWDD